MVAEESRQWLRDSERSGSLACMEPETIPLPECRMIRHDSHPAAFNGFPPAKAGIVTMKLRTFGFLAVVLVGLLLSSCAVTPRRAAISGAAEVGATQEHHPPGELRTSLTSADASDIYYYSFDRQYVS